MNLRYRDTNWYPWFLVVLLSGLLAYTYWRTSYIADVVEENHVRSFRVGYMMARPDADSVEVNFHAEWFRRYLDSDSTAYYVKPGTVVYDTIPTTEQTSHAKTQADSAKGTRMRSVPPSH